MLFLSPDMPTVYSPHIQPPIHFSYTVLFGFKLHITPHKNLSLQDPKAWLICHRVHSCLRSTSVPLSLSLAVFLKDETARTQTDFDTIFLVANQVPNLLRQLPSQEVVSPAPLKFCSVVRTNQSPVRQLRAGFRHDNTWLDTRGWTDNSSNHLPRIFFESVCHFENSFHKNLLIWFPVANHLTCPVTNIHHRSYI